MKKIFSFSLILLFLSLSTACSKDTVYVDGAKLLIGTWYFQREFADVYVKPKELMKPINKYYEEKYKMGDRQDFVLMLNDRGEYRAEWLLTDNERELFSSGIYDYDAANSMLHLTHTNEAIVVDNPQLSFSLTDRSFWQMVMRLDRTDDLVADFALESTWQELGIERPKNFETEAFDHCIYLATDRNWE